MASVDHQPTVDAGAAKPRRLVFRPLNSNRKTRGAAPRSVSRLSISAPLEASNGSLSASSISRNGSFSNGISRNGSFSNSISTNSIVSNSPSEYSLGNKGRNHNHSLSSRRSLARRSLSVPTSQSMANLSPSSPALPQSPSLYHQQMLDALTFETLTDELRRNAIKVDLDGTQLTVPLEVHKCVQFLSKEDPCEGVFRINGSIRKIKRIEQTINKQGIASFEFDRCLIDGELPNSYDVAMVLKRWLANLDNGLVTPAVNAEIKRDREYSMDLNLDTPNLDTFNLDTPNLDTVPELDSDGDTTMGDADITMEDAMEDPTDTPNTTAPSSQGTTAAAAATTATTTLDPKINTNYDAGSIVSGLDVPSSSPFHTSHLSELPIENIHLLVYTLHFLHSLTAPEVVEVTKMTTSNLAKLFQLTFFKSDDLTSAHPVFNNMSTGSLAQQSSDSLLEAYRTNEELLRGWIENYASVHSSLRQTIADRQGELAVELAKPVSTKTSTSHHHNAPCAKSGRSASASASAVTSAEKASRRRSVFGYRSLSSMFTNSSFNISGLRKGEKEYTTATDASTVAATTADTNLLRTGGTRLNGPSECESHCSEVQLRQPEHSIHSLADAHTPRTPLGAAAAAQLNANANLHTHQGKGGCNSTASRKSSSARPQSLFAEKRLSSFFTRHDHDHNGKENFSTAVGLKFGPDAETASTRTASTNTASTKTASAKAGSTKSKHRSFAWFH